MSGNRLDSDESFLDGLLFTDDDLDDDLDEDEVIGLLGGGGPSKLHGRPTPSYGGHFSSADGMVESSAIPVVTDENWRIVGDKVVFSRAASDDNGSGTKRLIRPEEVPGAKIQGEYVPLSKRNIAASRQGSPGVWIVPEKLTGDALDFSGMVFVKEEE